MKIIQLTYSLSSGGAERFVVDLCNRLAQNPENEVVLVMVLDEDNPSWAHYCRDLSPMVRLVSSHCRKGLSFKSIWRVFRVVTNEKAAVVHAHCNLIMLYLPALLVRKSKYVHTIHNLAEYCLGSYLLKPINRRLYRKIVKPVTISRECDRSFFDLYGLKTSACITNGREPLVPSRSFVPDIKIDSGCPVFIHVARCAPQKNQARLFKAFDRLYLEGVKFELMCLGSGYSKYMEHYKTHPQIHIVGERNNVGDYMKMAGYFVLSSDFEGLPLTLLEAMSMGLTPICTPAGGVVDVIKDGVNGYMTNGFGDEEFYRKLKTVMETNGVLPREIIRRDYMDNYSMQACAVKYYALYRQIIESK